MTFSWLWNWAPKLDCNVDYSYTSSLSANRFSLTSGNDVYTNKTSIVERVDGLAGVDTAVIGYAANCLSFTRMYDGYYKICVNGNAVMHVKNVERLKFNDATYVLNGDKWVKEVLPTITSLTSGNDTYADKAGVELVDGLAGSDTITFNANSGTIAFAATANGLTTLSINGSPVIQFKNIEQLEFTDASYVLNGAGQWVLDYSKLTSGNDIYEVGAGMARIDGMAGSDTVVFNAPASNLAFAAAANGFITVSVDGYSVQVRNVERIEFTNAVYEKNSSGQFVQVTTELTVDDDTYANEAGVEKIDGLAGTDTITFTEEASAATNITTTADGFTTVEINGSTEMQFRNIERLQFADAVYVQDANGDWVPESSGSSVIELTTGDDLYANVDGVEQVDGLAGTDTISFTEDASAATAISVTADGFTSLEINGTEEIQFRNIERLQFADSVLVLDANGDWVPESSGSSVIELTDGDDLYADVAGVEQVDGLAGTDTISFTSPLSTVTGAQTTADGFTSLFLSGSEVIQFKNIERLQFSDVALVKDANGQWSVEAPAPADFISLTNNDDVYFNVTGAEKVDGLAGTDSVVFNTTSANLSGLAETADGFTALNLVGQEAIQIRNIERVVFTDITFIKSDNGAWHVDPVGGFTGTNPSDLTPGYDFTI